MKRNEYVKFTQTGQSKGKKPLITGKSMTDPTFARTGRQMIFQPLNIEYRMKYPEGVPLDKENPLQFREFDKLYPDQFKAIREAKSHVDTTKETLDKLQKQHKENTNNNQQQND